MSRGFQGAMMRALGAHDHVITATGAHDVVPGFRRVTFRSDTLFDELTPGPTDYVRLWIPDPDDPDREVQRGYTVIEADVEAGTFAIDFVIHDPLGPASSWAAACEPGDELVAQVYGSLAFKVPSPEPAGILLIGDPASVPAINSILDAVPHHIPVEVILEWGHEQELAIPLAEHPNASVRWFPRDLTGAQVVAALAERDWTDWYAWVGAERATVKALKTALREVHGFPKTDLKTQAYWMYGKSFGSSRGSKQPAPALPTPQQQPVAEPTAAEPPASEPAPAPTTRRWRSQAGVEVLRPVRGVLRIAALATMVLTLAELVPYVLLAEVGRRLLDGQAVADQWPMARLALIVLGVASTLSAALLFWLHLVDARFALELRRRLVAKLARLPLGWFTERNSAAVKQTIADDTSRLHYYVTHAAVDVAGAVIAPLAVLVYLFVVDARLAALLLVPVIAYFVVFASMMQASRSKMDDVAKWSARLDAETIGFLDGLPAVRIFGGATGSGFRGTVGEHMGFLEDWQGPFVSKKATAALLTDAMTFLAIIVIAGGYLVASDRMGAADLLPFLLLGTTFGGRLLALAYNSVGLRESRSAAQRIGVTLTEDELDVADDGRATTDTTPAAEVALSGVTFGYRPGEPVLHDIDLALPAGSVTALVGPSGSGKSTLAALIARFHDPTDGTVRVGGDDLRTLGPDELYRRVAFVLQDPQILRASLFDNLALARPDADPATVRAASEAAALGPLIDRLPHGLDTVIGEDVGLSGGEAQCVAIARALLADTPVVVLDEATAYSDPDSEHQVQSALGRLLAGRTVLVIAHRLHTIVDADAIVVLDRGRVAQTGTHDELLTVDGRYRDLWSHLHTRAES